MERSCNSFIYNAVHRIGLGVGSEGTMQPAVGLLALQLGGCFLCLHFFHLDIVTIYHERCLNALFFSNIFTC